MSVHIVHSPVPRIFQRNTRKRVRACIRVPRIMYVFLFCARIDVQAKAKARPLIRLEFELTTSPHHNFVIMILELGPSAVKRNSTTISSIYLDVPGSSPKIKNNRLFRSHRTGRTAPTKNVIIACPKAEIRSVMSCEGPESR
jgi:hypothetical protein